MLVVRLVAVMGAFLCAPAIASAQQEKQAAVKPFEGTWFGGLGGSSDRAQQRLLIVNGTSCRWGIINGGNGERSPCTIEGNQLTLRTSAASTVTLTARGDALEGTFTPAGGSAYPLTMRRNGTGGAPAITPVTADPALRPFVGTWVGTRSITCSYDVPVQTRKYTITVNPTALGSSRLSGSFITNSTACQSHPEEGVVWSGFDIHVKRGVAEFERNNQFFYSLTPESGRLRYQVRQQTQYFGKNLVVDVVLTRQSRPYTLLI